MVLSLHGMNVPGNIRSRERKFPRAKVPGNFHSWERKFSVGTFAPRSENAGERKVLEPVNLVHYSHYKCIVSVTHKPTLPVLNV